MRHSFIRTVILCIAFICLAVFTACSGNNAEETFKTAQFEELQNNREHAEQLYREVIQKYADSEFAARAKDRLSELQKQDASQK